jgi:alkanesulfonate monooxygenase SsuD/methylene tetrahydromethanopterin reductase-like flavin-dependent oxidoreductase (luciferase family)
MNLGLMLGERPATVPALDHLDGILRQVEAGQRNGFTHFVTGQHFLVPGARWLQPIPLLARLAAELDSDARLVTWVLISPLYPPVMLAEELATLDIVTRGRLVVGLGVGYRPEEYEALGVPYEERIPRFVEGIALLKELWTNDRVTFAGRFTTLEDVDVHVRPLQEPHIPLWIGAQRPAGIRRAARLGDAWAISGGIPLDELGDRFSIYAAELATVGKLLTPQPFRQEIVIGETRDDALAQARVRMAEHPGRVGSGPRAGNAPRDPLAGFVLGSPVECAAQLAAIADRFPVDPIIARALWPSMTIEDAVAYIDTLGRELLPLLREHRPPVGLARAARRPQTPLIRRDET